MELRSTRQRRENAEYRELKTMLNCLGLYEEGMKLEEMRELMDVLEQSTSKKDKKKKGKEDKEEKKEKEEKEKKKEKEEKEKKKEKEKKEEKEDKEDDGDKLDTDVEMKEVEPDFAPYSEHLHSSTMINTRNWVESLNEVDPIEPSSSRDNSNSNANSLSLSESIPTYNSPESSFKTITVEAEVHHPFDWSPTNAERGSETTPSSDGAEADPDEIVEIPTTSEDTSDSVSKNARHPKRADNAESSTASMQDSGVTEGSSSWALSSSQASSFDSCSPSEEHTNSNIISSGYLQMEPSSGSVANSGDCGSFEGLEVNASI